MFKGGYQILDLSNCDMTTDGSNYLTNEETKKLIIEFIKKYDYKPVIVKVKLSSQIIVSFTTIMKSTSTGNGSIYGGTYEGNDYGLSFCIYVSLSPETAQFYYSEL